MEKQSPDLSEKKENNRFSKKKILITAALIVYFSLTAVAAVFFNRYFTPFKPASAVSAISSGNIRCSLDIKQFESKFLKVDYMNDIDSSNWSNCSLLMTYVSNFLYQNSKIKADKDGYLPKIYDEKLVNQTIKDYFGFDISNKMFLSSIAFYEQGKIRLDKKPEKPLIRELNYKITGQQKINNYSYVVTCDAYDRVTNQKINKSVFTVDVELNHIITLRKVKIEYEPQFLIKPIMKSGRFQFNGNTVLTIDNNRLLYYDRNTLNIVDLNNLKVSATATIKLKNAVDNINTCKIDGNRIIVMTNSKAYAYDFNLKLLKKISLPKNLVGYSIDLSADLTKICYRDQDAVYYSDIGLNNPVIISGDKKQTKSGADNEISIYNFSGFADHDSKIVYSDVNSDSVYETCIYIIQTGECKKFNFSSPYDFNFGNPDQRYCMSNQKYCLSDLCVLDCKKMIMTKGTVDFPVITEAPTNNKIIAFTVNNNESPYGYLYKYDISTGKLTSQFFSAGYTTFVEAVLPDNRIVLSYYSAGTNSSVESGVIVVK